MKQFGQFVVSGVGAPADAGRAGLSRLPSLESLISERHKVMYERILVAVDHSELYGPGCAERVPQAGEVHREPCLLGYMVQERTHRFQGG